MFKNFFKFSAAIYFFAVFISGQYSFAQYATDKLETVTADGSELIFADVKMPDVPKVESRGGLTGTLTIGGTSPNYATFTLAITDLIAQGVGTGGVIFNVRPGTYNERFSIPPVTGADATNTILFKNESASVLVASVGTSATSDAMITFDGCDYVIFDGISVQDAGTSTADFVEYGYLLRSAGGLGTDGATNNIVRNCGILLGGGIPGSAPAFSHGILISNPATATAGNNFNAIRNVFINNSDRGIGLFGQFDGANPPVNPDNGNEVSGCGFGDAFYIGNNLAAGGSVIGIIPSAQINFLMFNNTIYSVRVNNTANTLNATGIAVQNVSGSVYNNIIYEVFQASTANAAARAIGIQSGAISAGTVTFFNNFISGISKGYTGVANATQSVFGIRSTNFAGGGGTNAYHYNIIYLNSAAPVTYASIVFGSFAGNVPMITSNNIFVNAISTSSATARSGAIQDANAALGLLTSNYNCLAATGTNGVIGVNGAATYRVTLADWRTANPGLDFNSFVETPPFINVTAQPYNLHISTSTATQLESGGSIVSGITTDIDGNLRFGAPGYSGSGTAPDVGGDEGNFIPLDISPPVITYTPLLNTSSTSSRTLVVTVADPSGVPTTSNGWPHLYWKINAGSWTAATPTGVAGSDYTYNFGAGVVTGDVVSYYVVAQDGATTPNVGSFPSAGAGGFTANPPAAATPPTTPSSYTISSAALAGDYTVGLLEFNRVTGLNIYFDKVITKVMKEVEVEVPVVFNEFEKGNESVANDEEVSFKANTIKQLMEVEEISWVPMQNGQPYIGDLYIKKVEHPEFDYPAGTDGIYSTITAAVADLNLRGVSGHTTFLLTDATYLTETFPIAINVANTSMPSASATITIKPNTSVTSLIQGAAASSRIFTIRNSYVTIDGSNSGGTDRSLTIENTSATTPQVLLIGSTGTTPITNVSVKNCIVINGVNSSSAIVISDGNASGSAGYFSNITLQNNSIQKAYIGVYSIAVVASGNGNGLLLTGNDLSTSGANSIRLVGLYVQGVDGATVSNNVVGNIANTLDASNLTGTWFATGTVNSTISNNTFGPISGTASAPRGIAVSSSLPNTNINVSDNTVTGITTTSTGTATGIYTFGAVSGVTIQKNKVSNVKNTNTGGWGCNGIWLASTLTSSVATVSNNFVYDVAAYGYNLGAGTSDNGYGIVISAGAGYNVYYNSVSMTTDQTVDGLPAAFNVTSAVTTAGGLDVRNNIFANSQTLGVERYAIYSGAASTVYSSINYNDYYTMGPNLGFMTANQMNLAAWQTATGQDVNSISANPEFISNTDLHITPGSTVVAGMGVTIATVTTDIDGDTRLNPPDIGADEFGASSTFQLSVDVINAWNMVSVPGTNTDGMGVNTWWAFRDLGASVFKFSGSYTPVLITDPGEGYWMKHNGPRTYNTGDEWPAGGIQIVAHDPVGASLGWNLVGGYDVSVPVGSVTTTPPGLINATIFGFNGAYTPATHIVPGYAYWIKLSAAGTINMGGPLGKEGAQYVQSVKEDWGKIIITDASGKSFTLYAADGSIDLNYFEMPPLPPAGSFDVRFSSNRMAEDLSSSVQTIDMTSVEYPVVVTVENMSIRLMDETGKQLNENVEDGKQITINDSRISKLKVSGELIPTVYALEQNYPNPFNPSTTIEFSLPEDVNSVKLTIYNALGERVAELVNGSLMAGKYSYNWNARDVATGMYIYELRTDNFVSIKKMVLLK